MQIIGALREMLTTGLRTSPFNVLPLKPFFLCFILSCKAKKKKTFIVRRHTLRHAHTLHLCHCLTSIAHCTHTQTLSSPHLWFCTGRGCTPRLPRCACDPSHTAKVRIACCTSHGLSPRVRCLHSGSTPSLPGPQLGDLRRSVNTRTVET